MEDLTCGGDLCLSKALLDGISSTGFGIDLYKDYFKPFVLFDEDANLSCVTRFNTHELNIRKSFYNFSDPHKDPAFFSFFSSHDINRLSQVVKREIVIYLYHESNFEAMTKEKLCFGTPIEIYHDFRGLKPLPNSQFIEGQDVEEEEEDEQPFYFLFTSRKKLYLLDHDLDSLLSCSGAPFFAKDQLYSCWNDEGGCDDALEACDVLLECTGGQRSGNSEQTLNHSFEFAFANGQTLFKRWKKPVAVVYFCRNKFRGGACRWKNRTKPSNCYFTTLNLVFDDTKKVQDDDDDDDDDDVKNHMGMMMMMKTSKIVWEV